MSWGWLVDVAWDAAKVVGPIVGSWALAKLGIRANLSTRREYEAAADALADAAIDFAANWARNQVKKRSASVPVNQVIDMATDYFRKNAYGKLRKWATAKIEARIAARYDAKRSRGETA